ncbi:DUF7310 family coiled-coil domain-containing protein [Halorussus halobius]|uniref:DUF7310 family coiled-coil domain-containing protein n=1 Tax=Halorussus halobius TaxID=1710537 RepID=UPI001091C216|nr:hypothetical protein [Halorussus halobius]
MSDDDALADRLDAVERALTDEDLSVPDLGDAAELTREVESLSARLDDIEDRLDDLDAATQALRGYVGNVRAVNDEVERRADAALAKAESLEADLDALESERPDAPDASPEPRVRPTARGPSAREETPSSDPTASTECGCPRRCGAHAPPGERPYERSERSATTPRGETSDAESSVLARLASALSRTEGQ